MSKSVGEVVSEISFYGRKYLIIDPCNSVMKGFVHCHAELFIDIGIFCWLQIMQTRVLLCVIRVVWSGK